MVVDRPDWEGFAAGAIGDAQRWLLRQDSGYFRSRKIPDVQVAVHAPRIEGRWVLSRHSSESTYAFDTGSRWLFRESRTIGAWSYHEVTDDPEVRRSCWARVDSGLTGTGLASAAAADWSGFPPAIQALLLARDSPGRVMDGKISGTVPLHSVAGIVATDLFVVIARVDPSALSEVTVAATFELNRRGFRTLSFSGSDLLRTMNSAGLPADSYSAIRDNSWTVSYTGLGSPVRVRRPPAALVDPEGEQTPRCDNTDS